MFNYNLFFSSLLYFSLSLSSLSIAASNIKELTRMNSNPNTNELTLYFIPSPYGLSWDTPASITRTTIQNQISLKNRKIGHVIVELKCSPKENQPGFHYYTGMTGNIKPSKKLLLIDGIGLGMLYYNYDGHLENSDELKAEIPKQVKDKRINFTTFQISHNTCERLHQYFTEYKQKGYEAHYGLPNRPLLGEGGGCSAYGMSFLEVAGILDQELVKSWSYDLRVPLEFIGNPISDKKVNVATLLSPFKDYRWANEDEPHKKIFFWDPDTMYRWVKEKTSRAPASNYQVIEKDGMQGLIFDKSQVPTPTSPIWKN